MINKIFSILRKENWIIDDNTPCNKCIEEKYINKNAYILKRDNKKYNHLQFTFTVKGVKFILKKYLEKYPESSRLDEVIDKATNMTIKNIID